MLALGTPTDYVKYKNNKIIQNNNVNEMMLITSIGYFIVI